MITAKAQTDDCTVQVEFDATPWFEKAEKSEMIAL
jgi:hypothetical protein